MKRTVIDWSKRTESHLVSGSTYAIDQRLDRRGGNIFLDRAYVSHPHIAGVRSILLPQEHLWIMFFEGRHHEPPYRCYMHMAQIDDRGHCTTVDDLYLDVIIKPDDAWRVLDIDEFRQAVAHGQLTPGQIDTALLGLENACRLVERSRCNVEAYLREKLDSG